MDPQTFIAIGTLAIFATQIWLVVSNLRLRSRNRFLYRDNNRLQDIATRDGLTDLRSRGWFETNFPRFVERARRRGAWLAVIIVDLNDFKNVNDTYGHQIGDAVIKHVAMILEGCCRPTDVVARYGGEEFVMILPGAGRKVVERIARIAEETIRNSPISLPDGISTLSVTASFGGISRRGDRLDGPRLMEDADRRLYRAKDMKHSGAPTIVVESERTVAPRDTSRAP